MPGRDMFVIGASAGGFEAIHDLLRRLPADLPASLFIVVHLGKQSAVELSTVFSRSATLPVSQAVDGEEIQRGRIYVSRGDYHLLVHPGKLGVAHGPKENGFRPSVDALFRTAARSYGRRVAAVVLSGGLDDGTYGLMVVKEHGGLAIVQNPDEALVPNMPLNAMRHVPVDHVLPVAEMAPLLTALAREREREGAIWMVEERAPGKQQDFVERGTKELEDGGLRGPPSPFTCPECGGALWEREREGVLRYRCHVGHGFTSDSLVARKSDGLETALWTALRALEENAAVRRRMAARAFRGNLIGLAEGYQKSARESEQHAETIRNILLSETIFETGRSEEPG